jgi:hypothetical protein
MRNCSISPRDTGCQGVFVGFESPTVEGLLAVGKKLNLQKGRSFRASVRRIQGHGMCVVGSFIVGIDTDQRGIGEAIPGAAREYGIDAANVLILTPLPGTKLYAEMEREGRIRSNNYPQDWQYYTLTCPVADYKHLAWDEVLEEVNRFNNQFYSFPQILRRMLHLVRNTRSLRPLLVALVANLSYQSNHLLDRRTYASRIQSLNLGNAVAAEAGNAVLPLPETPFALAGHRAGQRKRRRTDGQAGPRRLYSNSLPTTSAAIANAPPKCWRLACGAAEPDRRTARRDRHDHF